MPGQRKQLSNSVAHSDTSGATRSPHQTQKRHPKRQKKDEDDLAARSLSLGRQDINTTGLPAFPDELLTEVLFQLPTVPLPTIEIILQDAKTHILRQKTLLALSQTCSNLRRFFRPYAWDRIEVVTSKGRASNRELLRQLEVVTVRDSSLAHLVKIVNLNIRNYSVLPVVKELARCFDMFPNLHSVRLQISYNPNERSQGYRSEVNRVFYNRSYPQIRSAIVSESVYDFLACCPQIRTAHPTERHLQYKSSFLCALFKCSQLENLEIDISMADYTDLPTRFPKLRSLALYFFTYPQDHSEIHEVTLQSLSNLKYLDNLVLRIGHFHTPQTRASLIDLGKALLLDLQKLDGRKKTFELTGQEEAPRDWPSIEEVKITFPAIRLLSAVDL